MCHSTENIDREVVQPAYEHRRLCHSIENIDREVVQAEYEHRRLCVTVLKTLTGRWCSLSTSTGGCVTGLRTLTGRWCGLKTGSCVTVLQMREVDGARQYLVQFDDGRDDEWVEESNLSEEVVKDWSAGLELAEAISVLDYEQRGTARKFLLRWRDGRPVSGGRGGGGGTLDRGGSNQLGSAPGGTQRF